MLPRLKILVISFFLIGTPSLALTLGESVEMALKNNPDILAQEARIKGFKSQVDQVVSTFYPTIAFEGTYGRYYRTPITYTVTPSVETTATAEVPGFPYIDIVITPETQAEPITVEAYSEHPYTARNWGLTFSQTLFSGGKRIHQLRIAQANVEIANKELRRKEQNLTYKVAKAYYDVLLAKKMYELGLESEKLARAELDQTQNYFRLGRISNAELLRSKIRAAEEKFNRIDAQNKLQVAKFSLNDILGREIDESIEVGDVALGDFNVSLPASQEILALAFENRPEWGIMGFKRKARERRVSLARADFYPTLLLRASLSKSYLDPDVPTEQDISGLYVSDTWFLYGLFSWNIFDSFRTQNRVKEAEANLEEIKSQEQQIRNRIFSEIKEAELYFDAAKQKIPVAKEQVDLAEQNLEQILENYRRGVAGNVEYLEAQKTLNGAKADLFRAGVELELAKAKINLAVAKDMFVLY